jgi:hypothetical protein
MAEESRAAASPLYAMGQLQHAIDSLAGARQQDRARLNAKAARWRAVLEGMATGTLSAGSRTPVAGTPAWVTLEVVHGGFASGKLLAEAPLRAEEQAIVDGLGNDAPGSNDRERLNLWFLTDVGQSELRRALAERRSSAGFTRTSRSTFRAGRGCQSAASRRSGPCTSGQA